MLSPLPGFLLVFIVAVEGTHKPVIFQKLTPLPVFVHLLKQRPCLERQHSLINSLVNVLLVGELLQGSAGPSVQDVPLSTAPAAYAVALGYSLYQHLAVAELATRMSTPNCYTCLIFPFL